MWRHFPSRPVWVHIFSVGNWESCQLFLLRRSRIDSLVFNSLNDALMSDASDTEYTVHFNIIRRIIFYNCPYNYLLFITATMLFDLMFSENNPCWSCHLVSLLSLIGINEIIMWESDTSLANDRAWLHLELMRCVQTLNELSLSSTSILAVSLVYGTAMSWHT